MNEYRELMTTPKGVGRLIRLDTERRVSETRVKYFILGLATGVLISIGGCYLNSRNHADEKTRNVNFSQLEK